jgi:RsiW-degrading membrane proteinase PrsW (M82 family)
LNAPRVASTAVRKLFGQAWATDWQAGLTAPFVEETSKGAIFLLMMGLAPVVVRTVSDGLIVGAYVGLGFQILEDIFYAQNVAFGQFGAHQSDAVLSTFVLRAVTGIPSRGRQRHDLRTRTGRPHRPPPGQADRAEKSSGERKPPPREARAARGARPR